MMQIKRYEDVSSVSEYILCPDSMDINIDACRQLFVHSYLAKETVAFSKIGEGRGQAYCFTFNDTPFVLRRFNRGGLVSSISTNRYMWFGLRFTRAYRELALLISMQAIGLPVPKPFSARVRKYGFVYSADLITYKINDAHSLAECSLSKEHTRWFSVGKVIRQFHDNGIYHADLNAHNILLTKNDVYIIDFDKGEKKHASGHQPWKKKNLQRLQRSLYKLKDKQNIYFSDENWQQLIAGYQSKA